LYDHNFIQPIISAVTGHNEESYVTKAVRSGMNQVLSKPVNHVILLEIITKLGYNTEKKELDRRPKTMKTGLTILGADLFDGQLN
jgi:YesN/AraC family two-component response regulator